MVMDREYWLWYAVQGKVLDDDILFSPRARSSAFAVLARLPASSGLGIEIRLQDGLDEVDVSWRLLDGEKKSLAASAYAAAVSESIFDHSGAIWIEIDDSAPAGSRPGLFFDLKPHQTQNGIRHGGDYAASDAARVAAALRHTRKGTFDQHEFDEFSRLLSHAPRTAHLHYCGIPGNGRDAGLRCCFSGVSPCTAAEWMTALGQTGTAARLAAMLDTARLDPVLHRGPDYGRCHWNYDCGVSGERRKASFEIGFGPGTFRTLGDDVLTRLTEAGLACVDKVRALSQWEGNEVFQNPQNGVSCLGRRINHVKIAADGNGAIEVKAYLYCGVVAL